ncbi:nitroreductase family protein [Candidatus Bipolaricaulota bacterium]
MTNPVLEAISKRKSVRSYKPDPVPRDIIQSIIEAGNQAPARGRMKEGSTDFNFQPWRFVVVEDADLKRKLVETTLPFWMNMTASMKDSHPNMYEGVMAQYEAMPEPKDMVYYASPAIVFVIGPKGFDVSCALACENMMIAATSLGLGSCYVGFGAMVTGNAEVVEALGLKEEEKIYGPILLGYPEAEASALANIGTEKAPPPIKWI